MGPRPAKHSLDRIDNEKGYSPENCRWATWTEQARNRRSAKMITVNAETLSVTEWAERIGVPRQTLYARIYRGLSAEDVASSAENRRLRLITWNGETMPLRAWASRLGINYRTLHNRLDHGWPLSKAFTEKTRKYEARQWPS